MKTKTKPPKKPYSKPELVVYGTLREITNTVGNKGAEDGGTGNTMRTHGIYD